MNAPAASRLCVDIFPACEKHGISPTRYLLIVNIAGQTVSLFEKAAAVVTDRRYNFVKKIPCSTSRFGIGQTEGSNRTPLGLHRIAEKIGAKITTRILWLEGLEPGFNRGGNVDSHARYIYLHGTADQMSIGQPASCGCIHLADADLIPLFDLIPDGTLVWISENDSPPA